MPSFSSLGFEFFREPHDPDDSKDYTMSFVLDAGESIATATVVVVDPTSETIDVSTDLTINTVAWGQILGTTYGVTFWPAGGTAGAKPGAPYYLRCRITTSAARTFDRTMVLLVAEL